MTLPHSLLQTTFYALIGCLLTYAAFVALLTVPFVQSQAIYLNAITLTWFQDVSVPETWGFLRNQVTPFWLHTMDGESLHAWHILPLALYEEHEDGLLLEKDGTSSDITQRLGFQLLRDDPDSLLVLYFHGAAGTLGSGWRPPSYRAMSAGSSRHIHTMAIDYRGFGSSTGTPSEEGLLIDALSLANWAMAEANIPSSRIVLFGQSLGTAVAISVSHHLAHQNPPVLFSGMVLVAPFADVELLTATYRVAGAIPLLEPLAYFPSLLSLINKAITSKWPSKDKLAEFVRTVHTIPSADARYHINIIHAEDDYDIPWSHSDQLYWHASNASTPNGISLEGVEKQKTDTRSFLGAGGWVATTKTEKGVIRQEIARYGLHDKIMSYPIISRAVARAFQLGDVQAPRPG